MIGALIESTSVLTQLRAATKPAHQRLEAALNLLDDDLNREDYKKILEKFHGFWSSWQPLIGHLMHDETLTRPRQRLDLLANDLLALGMSQAEIENLPACPMPALPNTATALGSLYVMEGSTLGGRVIEKNLLLRLGITRDSGGSYFHGYGDRTGLMWRDLLDRLDATPITAAAAINLGAIATFACLTSWFSSTG
jgi:heme oxygenase